MKKFTITGVFGVGLSVIANCADASIVSRGFLDEALTNYATNISLDLKADTADLTALSDIIGTPAELTYGDVVERSDSMLLLFGNSFLSEYGANTVPTNDISELIRLSYTDVEFPGILGVVEWLFLRRSEPDMWPIRLGDIFTDYQLLYDNGHVHLSELLLSGGYLKEHGVTVYGLVDLTTKVDANTAKIGTLPDGYESVGAALTAMNAKIDGKISDLSATATNGKYVLTAVKVGDQTTYAWELIDRSESEEAVTTE